MHSELVICKKKCFESDKFNELLVKSIYEIDKGHYYYVTCLNVSFLNM